MNDSTKIVSTYEQAFERLGVEQQYRTPEHFLFENAPDGTVHVVPRSILVEGEEFELRETGAVVSKNAHAAGALLGPRTIVKAGAVIMGLTNVVGANCLIDQRAVLQSDVTVGDNVRIGVLAKVLEYAEIEDSSVIGENTTVGASARVGNNVEVGDNVRIDRDAKVGHNSRLLDNTHVTSGDTIKPHTLLYPSETIKHVRKSYT